MPNLPMRMDIDLPVVNQKALPTVPASALKRFGCMHCEFAMTASCPVYTDEIEYNREGVRKLTYPRKGYCEYRVRWLASFLPNYGDITPSSSQVMLDLLKGLGHKRHLKDAHILVNLDMELDKLTTDGEPDDDDAKKVYFKRVKVLRGMINRCRNNVDATWKELMKIEDRQVDRETVKKVEVTKHIKPMDVARMIEDAKYQEVDDT